MTTSPAQSRPDDAVAITPELSRALLSYFAKRVSIAEDAADCLAETLIVLWRKSSALATQEDLRRYAFGVARNVLAAHYRGELRRRDLADSLRNDLRIRAQEQSAADARATAALAALRTVDRELVELIVWDGFGVAEAGALLGLTAAASRARYSRSRATLRKSLGTSVPRDE